MAASSSSASGAGRLAPNGIVAADHTWVGVVRAAPSCLKWPTLAAALRAQGAPVCDGYCPGWIDDTKGYESFYPKAMGRSL